MKKLDALLLVGWVVLPPLILWLLHGNLLISIFLYFVLPSIFFSFKRSEVIPRAVVVSLAAMLLGSTLDYIAFLNHAWVLPTTVFPLRFLQLVPIEDFLWSFWQAYVIISGFNYFFPTFNLARLQTRRLKRTGVAVLSMFLSFLLVYTFYPNVLLVNYYGAWLTFAFALMSIILFVGYPLYRKPLLWVVGFQIVLLLPYELSADALGFWWTYPADDYLGMIHIFGQNFPVEEFLQWMIFYAPATLAFNIFIAGDSAIEGSSEH